MGKATKGRGIRYKMANGKPEVKRDGDVLYTSRSERDG